MSMTIMNYVDCDFDHFEETGSHVNTMPFSDSFNVHPVYVYGKECRPINAVLESY